MPSIMNIVMNIVRASVTASLLYPIARCVYLSGLALVKCTTFFLTAPAAAAASNLPSSWHDVVLCVVIDADMFAFIEKASSFLSFSREIKDAVIVKLETFTILAGNLGQSLEKHSQYFWMSLLITMVIVLAVKRFCLFRFRRHAKDKIITSVNKDRAYLRGAIALIDSKHSDHHLAMNLLDASYRQNISSEEAAYKMSYLFCTPGRRPSGTRCMS